MIETLASRPDNNTDNPDSEPLTSLKSHLPIVQPTVGKDNEVAPSISDFDFQPNTKRPSFLPPFVPRPRTIPPKPLFGSNDVRNTSNYPHKAARFSADPVISPLGSQKSPQNVTNQSTLYPKPNTNSPTTFSNHDPKTDTDTYNPPKFKSFFCPQQQLTFTAYCRDPTPEEDCIWTQELAKRHPAPIARSYVASVKAARAEVRSYLQEKKGLTRVYAPGDWVLPVRQRNNKFEPYYDGPWAIAS
ncbi:hypothetical protein K3495_g15950 [Podosphaera aphanis]|nr:hypothetical protein K3495_g15950 [Podosphaera aphanis]